MNIRPVDSRNEVRPAPRLYAHRQDESQAEHVCPVEILIHSFCLGRNAESREALLSYIC